MKKIKIHVSYWLLLVASLGSTYVLAQPFCPASNCPADGFIQLTTGIDNFSGGRPINIGEPDPNWMITSGPKYVNLGPAVGMDEAPYGFSPDNWISWDPLGIAPGTTDEFVTFQRCFCNCASGTINYDLTIFADNHIEDIWLGSHNVYHAPGSRTNYFDQALPVAGTVNINAGQSCLTITITNRDDTPTGIGVMGTLDGPELLAANCCSVEREESCCDTGNNTIFQEDFSAVTSGSAAANYDLRTNGPLYPGMYGAINSQQANQLSNGQWTVADPTGCDPGTPFLAVNGRTGGAGQQVLAYESRNVVMGLGEYDLCIDFKHLPQCLFDQQPTVTVEVWDNFNGYPIYISLPLPLQEGIRPCHFQTFTDRFAITYIDGAFDSGLYTVRIYLDETPPGDGNDFAVDNILINQRLPPNDPSLSAFTFNDLRSTQSQVEVIPTLSTLPVGCQGHWEVWQTPNRSADPSISVSGTYQTGDDSDGWMSNVPHAFPGYAGGLPRGFFERANTYVIERHVQCGCALPVVTRRVLAGSDGTIPEPPGEDSHQPDQAVVSELHLYPNPATHTLQLTTDQVMERDAAIELYTATGQRVQATALAAGNRLLTLDVSQLPAGLYYVVLERQGERHQKRFVKQ